MAETRSFVDLCDVAERNDLVVEIMSNSKNERAIWIFTDKAPHDCQVVGVNATMRVAVVATPFMANLPYDAMSPQLISMLAVRGYI